MLRRGIPKFRWKQDSQAEGPHAAGRWPGWWTSNELEPSDSEAAEAGPTTGAAAAVMVVVVATEAVMVGQLVEVAVEEVVVRAAAAAVAVDGASGQVVAALLAHGAARSVSLPQAR